MNGSLTSDSSKVMFRDISESHGIAETVMLQHKIASDHEPDAGSFKQPTGTQQLCQPCSDQLVIAKDEVERITGELIETKTLLVERDSQLKDLGSEVNQLRSKLKESEDLSSQLTEDIDRLKSELSDGKEKQISIEKSFSEREEHLNKALLKCNERELTYKEKEMQLIATVEDVQKQLCQKTQELELLKTDHSSNLNVLDIMKLTIEDLSKRCGKKSNEITKKRKAIENIEARTDLAADDMEDLTGTTAEGGNIQKEYSVNKVETDSCSTDQFGDNDDGVLQSRGTCKLCFMTFPVGTSVRIIRDHLQLHQKVCPVCNKKFELNCTQPEFETHVSEHLADTIKRPDDRKICPMCDLEFPPAWAQEFEVHVNQHFADTLRP